MSENKGLLTVKQFCISYSWPSESAMRAYIYRAKELKLDKCFIRIGRRVLIDADLFFETIKKGNINEKY
jgi:hypothetical protein